MLFTKNINISTFIAYILLNYNKNFKTTNSNKALVFNLDIQAKEARLLFNLPPYVFYSSTSSLSSLSSDKIAVKFILPCSSISRTLTVTLSPTLRTSSTFLILSLEILEI